MEFVRLVIGILDSKLHPKALTLQEFHFRSSLKEIGIEAKSVRVDHARGRNWCAQTGWVPIVFPESYIRQAHLHASQKTQKYFFKGVIGKNREWIREYTGVRESNRGRNKNTKYVFDIEYFEALGATEFGLSPTGDCPWSYRFFEAIMAMAIPVLGRNEADIFADEFQVTRDGEDHFYDIDAAAANFTKLLSNHTLRGLLDNPVVPISD